MDEFWKYYVLGSGTGIVTFVGLVVSCVGFLITIWNTSRSKTAAQRAEQAVLKVRRDLQKTNATIELTTAIRVMVEIQKLHLQGQTDWNDLREKYFEAKNSLIQIHNSNTSIPVSSQQSIQGIITNLASLEKQIGKAIIDKKDYPDNSNTYGLISNKTDVLQTILAEIRNTLGD